MKRIRLLTWPGYLAPETVEHFRRETGADVELEVVPSAADLVARMQTPDAGIDVLCPPDYAVRELAARGRLHTLDPSRLLNLVHLQDRFRKGRPHDPQGRWSVVKDWGTLGFMYRTDIVRESPTSWKDFWHLALRHSGMATVLDSPGEVIGAALKMRGHSYNASSEEALAMARDDLLRLKPHLLAFETDYKPLLASGRACLSLGWNGDAAVLASAGTPLRYVIPMEGSQVWEDDWAIAADAADPVSAHTFLDFMLRPDVAAREAVYTGYATPNRSALQLLDPALRDDRTTYPADGTLDLLEVGLPMDAAGQARREHLWRQVRG